MSDFNLIALAMVYGVATVLACYTLYVLLRALYRTYQAYIARRAIRIANHRVGDCILFYSNRWTK